MVSNKSLEKISPAISVLLPVYNAEKYLSLAIESILQQTFNDFEFIIIDDCSSDTSWKIISQFAKQDKRIIAVQNTQNLGGCNTLNKGLKMVKGKYVARVDNDDWSYPDRFKKQFTFMESHPQVGVVGGTMELMNETGMVIGKRTYNLSDSEIREKIFRYSPFSHPLVMFRTAILHKVGYYNPEYIPADDYDLYFRIGKVAKLANIQDVLLKYRVVQGSMTHTLTKMMELTTIKVRMVYANDQSYHMSVVDRIYTFMQYLTIFVLPSKFKLYLFNRLRNTRS